jgi:hypothetical protein
MAFMCGRHLREMRTEILHGHVAGRAVIPRRAGPQPCCFHTLNLQKVGISAEVHVQSHGAREDEVDCAPAQ